MFVWLVWVKSVFVFFLQIPNRATSWGTKANSMGGDRKQHCAVPADDGEQQLPDQTTTRRSESVPADGGGRGR